MEGNKPLEGYKLIKKLGKGSFGEVILAENAEGEMEAVKMISKQRIDEHSHESLKSQIQLMQKCDSDYIMKLLRFDEDNQFYYLFCEFCNEGDLFNYQAKKKNRVFDLDEAIQAMSSVIKGLFHMHRRDILHRDIKSQNIIANRDSKGIISFKLADLGFAKHHQEVQGTILGTQKFMSPEVFCHKPYGFEVDMWAFGVTLFFMLNMEYPFNINPHVIFEQRTNILKKLATNYSYKEAVKNSKKKILQNCSQSMQDLFKRMFDPNPNTRIKFSQIRQHPIFKQYFPDGAAPSAIIYKNNYKYTPKQIKKKQTPDPIPPTVILKKSKNLQQQRQVLEAQLSKLNFLRDTDAQIKMYTSVLTVPEMLAFRYLLSKMHLKYNKQMIQMLNQDNLKKSYPKYDWAKFCSQKSFHRIIAKQQHQFSQAQMVLDDFYQVCQQCIKQISSIENHHHFSQVLQSDYTEQKSGNNLLKAFNYSSRHCYKKFSQKQSEDAKYGYMALIMLLCVVFRKIFPANNDQLVQVLSNYSNSRKNTTAPIDFDDLRMWLSKIQKKELVKTLQNISNKYLKGN